MVHLAVPILSGEFKHTVHTGKLYTKGEQV
jgi:hypothetical protein